MSNHLTIIEARSGSAPERLFELWKFRSFYGFLLREISMRKFRQTMLGFWWLVIRPLVPAIAVIVTFTAIVSAPREGVPYPIFFLSGYVCWTMFQSTAVFMPRTLMWMQGIIRKTYFPKLLVPLASLGPPLIELAVSLCLLAIAVAYYALQDGQFYLRQDTSVLLFPACIFGALVLAVASGMVTSVVAVIAKDVVFSMGYVLQIGMLITPVIYPVSAIPEQYQPVMFILNPMSVYVEAARWSLTGEGFFQLGWFLVAVGMTTVLFALATWFFIRSENFLGDAL